MPAGGSRVEVSAKTADAPKETRTAEGFNENVTKTTGPLSRFLTKAVDVPLNVRDPRLVLPLALLVAVAVHALIFVPYRLERFHDIKATTMNGQSM